MAFDALRLRNVIQLVGILCVSSSFCLICQLNPSVGSVFHAALIFFAAVQIHETKTALVRLPDCDGTVNYVVCSTHHRSYGLSNSHLPFQVVWWPWHIVQKGGASTHRCPGYHRGCLDYLNFLREGALLRIWVSN
jgi:hypothetical protein